MRCAQRIPFWTPLRSVLRTGRRPPARQPCRTAASSCARRNPAPGKQPGSNGYRRPAATASPLLTCAGCKPAGGACRAALSSAVHIIVRSFLPTSPAIPPEVLPSAAGPACRVHKKGRTACLPPFLQSFGIHSRHPRASHPTGQELSKKR